MQGTGPAAAALKTTFLAAGLSFFCGCATSGLDIIQVGPWSEPCGWKQVEVFSSREQTTRPWGGTAIIHGVRVPSGDSKSIEKQKLKARKMAAAAGADAIIITVETAAPDPDMAAYGDQQVFLSALAIKYVASVSTAVLKQN